MNAIMNKTNNGKLLAALAILAMVVCVFAIAAPADADGVVTVPSGAETITDASTITADMDAGNYVVKSSTTITINSATEVPTGVTIYVQGTFTVSADMEVNGSVIFLNGSSLTVNGHNYFGTSGYIVPAEGASLTVKSNANNGYDMILDGEATTINLPIWASETFTVTAGSTLTVNAGTGLSFNGLFTNNGTLIVNGVAKLHDGQANLVNNGLINVANGGQFTIDNATGNLRNNGTFYNNGTVTNSGAINNYGSFYNNATLNNSATLYNAGQLYSTTALTGVSGSPVTSGFGISNNMDAIETNLDLTGYAFLTSDLTIPEKKSITVGSNAILDLRGHTLTVEGELIIEMGGTVIGYDGDATYKANAIVLSKGTITNNGTIGSGQVAVTVGVDQNAGNEGLESSVQLLNVEGVSFGTTTVGQAKTVYLTVTGDVISAITSSDNYIFNINGAYIVGEMTISDEIKSTISTRNAVVAENATLTIDGEVSGEGDIQMLNNSTVNVMGTCGVDITAGTGKAQTTNYTAPGTTTVTLNNVTGVTLSVTSTSAVEQEGDESVRYTTRVMNISGAVDLIDETGSAAVKGTITVVNANEGVSYVPAEATLSIPEDITAALGGTNVIGTVVYEDNNSVTQYIGTQYSVREGTTTTYYIKSFTGALEQIANAYRNTVYVSGPVEVEADFTLSEGQIVNIADTTYGGFTISADATVTVQSGARITGTIEEVEGVLTLMRGAPDAVVNKYAVYSENNDGTRTYSGFAAAIANSAAGDTITVIGQGYETIEVEGNVTIPSDRTVIVQKNMTFDGNLVIDEGATVNNQATITMTGQRSTITVNGTMDNTDSTAAGNPVVFDSDEGDKANRGVYANGQYIVDNILFLGLGGTNTVDAGTMVNAFVNGAVYQNEDGEYVVTSFTNAVAAIAENDLKTINVIGTVSESGDITVGNGEDEYSVVIGINSGGINMPGVVTLGNITLDYASISVIYNEYNNTGKLTANVSGAYGIEGSESVATIALNGAMNVTISNDSEPNSLAETVWYNTVGGALIGAITISAGEVELAASATPYTVSDTDSSLAVAAGATLVVPKNVTLNLTDDVTVNGTLSIEEEGAVLVAEGSEAIIAGTLSVEGALTIDDDADGTDDGILTIAGTLVVTEDGVVNIDGVLKLGETPKTLGEVSSSAVVTGTITVTGQIIAYSGSDVSGAVINASANTAAKYTAYTINDIAYATVYGSGTISGINAEVFGLDDLSVKDGADDDETAGADDIVWYYNGEAVTGSIGAYEAVSTEIDYATVTIKVSVGSQISIVVDDIVYQGSTDLKLTIGTHTVSAVINPGYTGEVTITFNGQAVTDGQIEITSDMIGESIVLSAVGNITQDSTVVIDGGSSGDSGMGLTDYLLIILVILIVVMAIMVAMRLMRS